jgi:lipopolysaccharide transport system permease protein
LETRVYSNSNKYSIKDILVASFKGYKNSFYLAKQLAKRDIKAMYRQSFLGLFWALLPVLINAFVWILLQSSGAVQLAATGVPYPLFVLVGTTIWSIFGDCLTMPISTVNANIGIVTKINFEKEALITSGFLKLMFNLLIKFGLIFLFLVYFQKVPTISILYFIPLLFLTMLFFISVGILITPIGVLYSDISRLIPIALQILMYCTPVLYLIPKEGLLKLVMNLNPLSYFIIDIRNSLIGLNIEHWFFWTVTAIFTLVLTVFALIVYRVSMPIITERMSS